MTTGTAAAAMTTAAGIDGSPEGLRYGSNQLSVRLKPDTTDLRLAAPDQRHEDQRGDEDEE
jgi:hypothetical protein